jgi:hypothetical protein
VSRSPAMLDAAIEEHKRLFGKEPERILINDNYRTLFKDFFKGRLHMLCCGKGALYRGIPAMLTVSPLIDDFLIAY